MTNSYSDTKEGIRARIAESIKFDKRVSRCRFWLNFGTVNHVIALTLFYLLAYYISNVPDGVESLTRLLGMPAADILIKQILLEFFIIIAILFSKPTKKILTTTKLSVSLFIISLSMITLRVLV